MEGFEYRHMFVAWLEIIGQTSQYESKTKIAMYFGFKYTSDDLSRTGWPINGLEV